jgi:3-dehydroquinate synthase
MSTLRVALEPAYDVHVAEDGFAALGPLVRAVTPRAFVVTDPFVGPLYARAVVDVLAANDVPATVLEMPDGEARKNLDAWRSLVEGLLAQGIDRKSAVVALGGGVVGDVAGFAAATVLRGVPFVQVPTTLLAMVDSSVGGKTGVNAAGGKNLVGAFHQPRFVYAALHTLDTLPRRELLSGLGEVVKHGLIRDAELFELLERNPDGWTERAVVRELVERSVRVKAAIIAADEREQGVRVILNFGHTVGHALEVTVARGELNHGECVALGMLAESRWATAQGACDPAVVARLQALLQRLGFPTAPPPIDRKALETAGGIDKKVAHGILATAVLERVGWARHDQIPGAKDTIAQMLAGLQSLRTEG